MMHLLIKNKLQYLSSYVYYILLYYEMIKPLY